jgi:hypothetical protein
VSPLLVDVDSPVEVRVIDMLIADLNAHADLPAHNTVYYRRPAAVLPEDCPLLCVYLMTKGYQGPVNLGTYDPMAIGITWQEEGIERAETMFGPGEGDFEGAERRLYDARDLLRNMKRIEERIRRLAGFGGFEPEDVPQHPEIPELDSILPQAMNYMPAQSIETGLVEGYAMTVEVTVHEH